MENKDNLQNLLLAMHEGEGFNHISRGNLWNEYAVSFKNLRDILKELCYAVERHCDRDTMRNITEEFEDNITDISSTYVDAMPWYDNRWREDNEDEEED